MELNAKKCSEVIMDVRKNKTVIPPAFSSFWDFG